MSLINISGINILLIDEQYPIGVSLSGGADSAVLAFILMKYSKSPIHFFTLGHQSKKYIPVIQSINVIQKCIDLTGNFNVKHHIEFAPTQEREHLFKFLKENIDSSLVKIMYTATTQVPPMSEMAKFKNTIDQGFIERRDSTKYKPVFHYNNKLYNPFLNFDKKDIKNLYNDLGILDSLFPISRSCGQVDIFPYHCGDCWMCEERMWAFGKQSCTTIN